MDGYTDESYNHMTHFHVNKTISILHFIFTRCEAELFRQAVVILRKLTFTMPLLFILVITNALQHPLIQNKDLPMAMRGGPSAKRRMLLAYLQNQAPNIKANPDSLRLLCEEDSEFLLSEIFHITGV